MQKGSPHAGRALFAWLRGCGGCVAAWLRGCVVAGLRGCGVAGVRRRRGISEVQAGRREGTLRRRSNRPKRRGALRGGEAGKSPGGRTGRAGAGRSGSERRARSGNIPRTGWRSANAPCEAPPARHPPQARHPPARRSLQGAPCEAPPARRPLRAAPCGRVSFRQVLRTTAAECRNG